MEKKKKTHSIDFENIYYDVFNTKSNSSILKHFTNIIVHCQSTYLLT